MKYFIVILFYSQVSLVHKKKLRPVHCQEVNCHLGSKGNDCEADEKYD